MFHDKQSVLVFVLRWSFLPSTHPRPRRHTNTHTHTHNLQFFDLNFGNRFFEGHSGICLARQQSRLLLINVWEERGAKDEIIRLIITISHWLHYSIWHHVHIWCFLMFQGVRVGVGGVILPKLMSDWLSVCHTDVISSQPRSFGSNCEEQFTTKIHNF